MGMTAAVGNAAPAATPDNQHRQLRGALRVFCSNPVTMIAALVMLLNVVVAVAAPLISPYDPLQPDFSLMLGAPNAVHWLGTDSAGRDVLSRVIWGGRVSLSVSVVSVLFGLILGVLIGLPSGYFAGRLDNILMRLMDVLLTFPAFLLALIISAAMGASIQNVVIAIGVSSAPRYARLVRGAALTSRSLDYVTAAIAIGSGHLRIMIRHVLPNIVAPVVVYATLYFSTAIITEASLSFLGFGVQPPTPSWGSVISDGRTALVWAPWISAAPGVVISIAVIALNLLGDAFRDALDPRLRGEAGGR